MFKMEQQYHLFLKQEKSNTTTKHFYFRYTSSKYECEEFVMNNGNVEDLNYYETDEKFFNSIVNSTETIGSSPVVYFGNKKTEWVAFGEEIIKKE
jgi:hypothetical protein